MNTRPWGNRIAAHALQAINRSPKGLPGPAAGTPSSIVIHATIECWVKWEFIIAGLYPSDHEIQFHLSPRDR
ncbi:hypothetical protein [Elongatibacter sediminis]|uniref:Uncharacterized protein n=1 Tax=Elongatibacter sediminis TaxID=3119006 RepID=A0AAW9RCE1_9GAMM